MTYKDTLGVKNDEKHWLKGSHNRFYANTYRYASNDDIIHTKGDKVTHEVVSTLDHQCFHVPPLHVMAFCDNKTPPLHANYFYRCINCR